MEHIYNQLLAGVSFADSKKLMTVAGYLQPDKGLLCSYAFAYTTKEFYAAKDLRRPFATKYHEFEWCVYGVGRPVLVVVTQHITDRENHRERVDIYDAATLDWLSGNDEGNFPPVTNETKDYVIDIINRFIGRPFAVRPVKAPVRPSLVPPAPQAQTTTTTSRKEARSASQPASAEQVEYGVRFLSAEHDLTVATKLIHQMRKAKMTRREFRTINRDSQRYDGEWSRGRNMTQRRKNTVDTVGSRRYNSPCQAK